MTVKDFSTVCIYITERGKRGGIGTVLKVLGFIWLKRSGFQVDGTPEDHVNDILFSL